MPPGTDPTLYGSFGGSYRWAPRAAVSPLNGTIDKPRKVSLNPGAIARGATPVPQTAYTYSATKQQSILPNLRVAKYYVLSEDKQTALATWGMSAPLKKTQITTTDEWGSPVTTDHYDFKVTASVSPVTKALGSLFSDLNSMIRFHSNSGDTTRRPPFDSSPIWNSYEDGHKLWGDPTDPAADGSFRGVFSDNSVNIKKLMDVQANVTQYNSGSGGTAVSCNFVPGQSIFQSPINALHYAMAYAEKHTFGDGATFCLLRVSADGEPKVIGTTITTVEDDTPRPGIVEFGMATIGERPAWRPILRDRAHTAEHPIDTDDFTGWGPNIITTHAGTVEDNGNATNVAPGKAQLHTDLSGGGYIIVLVPGPDMKRGAILYELYKAYDKYNPKTRLQFDQLLGHYHAFTEMWRWFGDLGEIGTILAGTDDSGKSYSLPGTRTELFKFVSEFSKDSLRSTYMGNLTKQPNPLDDRNWVAAAKFTLTDSNESAILGEIEARNACEDIMQQLEHLPLITELMQKTSDSHGKTYGFYIEYGNSNAPEIIFKKVNNDSWWFGLGQWIDGNDPLALLVNDPLKTYEVLHDGTLQEIVQRVIPADEADTGTISSLWAPLTDYITGIEFNDYVKMVLLSGGTLTLFHYTYAQTK